MSRSPEKNRAKVKAWKLANPEKVKAQKAKYKKAWAKRNPEKVAAKRRARIERNGAAYTRHSPERRAELSAKAAETKEFRGPGLWKNGPHLAVWVAWDCGSDPLCRTGKVRARCAKYPNDRHPRVGGWQIGKDWLMCR